MKDLTTGLNDAVSVEVTEAIAALATLILGGKIPDQICVFLYGVSLTALLKKDGGIRPIAVGLTLRRLAGKIISERVMSAMGELIRPEQVGYSTKGGTEATVHAARLFVNRNYKDCQVLLKLDFKNAFNTIFRDKLLTEVDRVLPEYSVFARQLYRQPSNLIYGDKLPSSARGVQQGDSLGPFSSAWS